MLPGGTVEWADWTHELGAVYLVWREFDEARRCYSAAVETFSILGDYGRVARGQHSLGVLAQAQGDYRLAERHYRRSTAAEKKATARKQAAKGEREPQPTADAPAEGPANTAEGPANTAEGPANTPVKAPPSALASGQSEAELADGEVDSRLLAALATIADLQPLRIIAFGDAGPGAAAAVPLRSVVIAPADQAGPGWAHSVLTFLAAQRTPFRPASAGWDLAPGYPYALRIEYASPSPFGLLTTSGASQGFTSTHE